MRTALRRIASRSWQFIAGVVLGVGIVAHPTLAALQQPTTIPVAWVPPPGVVQISPCVPTMGEHWADPATMPMGPIYTVDRGRLMSIEYMPAQADFAEGRSWNDLAFTYWGQPLTIQHADVDFLAHGHEGYEVPHYDMHFYLVNHGEDRAITCQP